MEQQERFFRQSINPVRNTLHITYHVIFERQLKFSG